MDFEIQADHLIPARRPDYVMINTKRELAVLWLYRLSGPPSENQRKRKGKQIIVPCQWTKKAVEHERWRRLDPSPKACKGDWKSWKSEDESRLSRLQFCCDRSEYREEFWRHGTGCHSDSRERSLAKIWVKNS